MDHDIRYSEASDERALLKWLLDPDDLQWFPMSEGEELNIAVRNWIGFSKFRSSLTATVKGEPAAVGTLFLMPYKKVAHQASFYLIVDKRWRKKGIGDSMLKNLLNLAKNYFRLDSLYAEIYEGCPILSVLEKNGFERFVYQKDFVKDNGYKARIILERELK